MTEPAVRLNLAAVFRTHHNKQQQKNRAGPTTRIEHPTTGMSSLSSSPQQLKSQRIRTGRWRTHLDLPLHKHRYDDEARQPCKRLHMLSLEFGCQATCMIS